MYADFFRGPDDYDDYDYDPELDEEKELTIEEQRAMDISTFFQVPMTMIGLALNYEDPFGPDQYDYEFGNGKKHVRTEEQQKDYMAELIKAQAEQLEQTLAAFAAKGRVYEVENGPQQFMAAFNAVCDTKYGFEVHAGAQTQDPTPAEQTIPALTIEVPLTYDLSRVEVTVPEEAKEFIGKLYQKLNSVPELPGNLHRVKRIVRNVGIFIFRPRMRNSVRLKVLSRQFAWLVRKYTDVDGIFDCVPEVRMALDIVDCVRCQLVIGLSTLLTQYARLNYGHGSATIDSSGSDAYWDLKTWQE